MHVLVCGASVEPGQQQAWHAAPIHTAALLPAGQAAAACFRHQWCRVRNSRILLGPGCCAHTGASVCVCVCVWVWVWVWVGVRLGVFEHRPQQCPCRYGSYAGARLLLPAAVQPLLRAGGMLFACVGAAGHRGAQRDSGKKGGSPLSSIHGGFVCTVYAAVACCVYPAAWHVGFPLACAVSVPACSSELYL